MWDLITLVGLGLVYCLVYLIVRTLQDARWTGVSGLLIATGILLSPVWGISYALTASSLGWTLPSATAVLLLFAPPWIAAFLLAVRLRRNERLNNFGRIGFLGFVGFVLPCLYIARMVSMPQLPHADLPGLCFIPAVGAGMLGMLVVAVRLTLPKPVEPSGTQPPSA